ncbi:3-phytase A [Escovopsis weberi]|uniref:3-phytase A n=1 Tax=Escovopsis weberi TaxID=150374 RepID=A0A0N0RTP4_ESCWE|nr:3-phytase A [Escovopsis weberi]
MLANALLALAAASGAEAAKLGSRDTKTPTSTTPNSEAVWFTPVPEIYAGAAVTGPPAMLAQINPGPFRAQFDPSNPLQTSQPIAGAAGRNIFQHMGPFSPYFVPEDGFGVDEYPLPEGSEFKQVYLVHRHGSRYPSDEEDANSFAHKIANVTAQGVKFSGDLDFLNDLVPDDGLDALVAKGRQELFESGVQHYYNYGGLLDKGSSHKLVVRSTSVDRAYKSAENFLAGMFGLDWKDNADILTVITANGFNNSLSGSGICPHAAENFATLNKPAMVEWQNKYLKERTEQLRSLAGGYNWTIADSYNAQTMCAYQTITAGYSKFCDLFNWNEWEGYGYSNTIMSSSLAGFASPCGRALGAAWVAEFIARVQGHLPDIAPGTTTANITQDSSPVAFPLDQGMYLDFGHDISIWGVIMGFGFRQFAEFLPASGPTPGLKLDVAKITPFAGRIAIEIIEAPHAVNPVRGCEGSEGVYDTTTGNTSYVHVILNQRTVPLHASFPECAYRDDGWCELSTFLDVAKKNLDKAEYEWSCFGNWTIGAYGSITDGVAPKS